MVIQFEDGRSLTVPLEWFPRLQNATPQQRNNWEMIGHIGMHWPEVDEDISIAGLFNPAAIAFLKQRAEARKRKLGRAAR